MVNFEDNLNFSKKDTLYSLFMDISTIIQNYSCGYFLMADDDDRLGWYSTNRRTVMPLDSRFTYPKSLRRAINQQRFQVRINQDFLAVCEGCANRESTWISPELIKIYYQLYQAGWAYSFETWEQDQLAGGVLGIAIRGVFIGESMFYQIPEGSKVALVKLVEYLRQRGYLLFDVQMQNPHLERFGSYLIGDRQYQSLLQQALKINCNFVD